MNGHSLWQRVVAEFIWIALPAGRRRRFRDHGRAAGGRQCCHSAISETALQPARRWSPSFLPLVRSQGAHLNPAVTLADAWQGGIAWRETLAYISAQFIGAYTGVATAHLMFGLPLFSASTHIRSGRAQCFSEFVATFGLLAVIWGCARRRPSAVAFSVGAYITGAYWFTASTSFANPAVTLARSVTNTFAGIRPSDTAAFVGSQLAGAFLATLLFRWLTPSDETNPSMEAEG